MGAPAAARRTGGTSSAPAPNASRRVVALVGATACLLALVAVWSARLRVAGTVYVSALGAASMPTAALFNAALLVLAAGGLLVAVAYRGRRAAVPVLGAWSVSASLAVAGVAFAVASRVPCTAGCPVPLTAGSTPQDLVHVVVAVTGFAAAAWAMLQVAGGGGEGAVRRASGVAGGAVAAVSAAGGLLSVLGVRTDVGAALELGAMTIAVLWLVLLGAVTACARPARADDRGSERGTARL